MGPRERRRLPGPVQRLRSGEKGLDFDFDTPLPCTGQALIQIHPEPAHHGDLASGSPSDIC